MSDERLRELERRWRETGAVEDEAKFLAERARSGSLPRKNLELAAALGHEASGRVVGDERRLAHLEETLAHVDAADPPCRARVFAELARLSLEECRGLASGNAAERGVTAIIDALSSPPCARAMARANEAAEIAIEALRALPEHDWFDDPYEGALLLTLFAAKSARGDDVSFASQKHTVDCCLKAMGLSFARARRSVARVAIGWLLSSPS